MRTYVFISQVNSRTGISERQGKCIFNFQETAKLFSQVAVLCCVSTSNRGETQVLGLPTGIKRRPFPPSPASSCSTERATWYFDDPLLGFFPSSGGKWDLWISILPTQRTDFRAGSH